MQLERDLRRKTFKRELIRHIPFYLMLIIPMAQVIIFNYLPIYGVQIAFKDFKMRRGIMGSDWIGFDHFKRMFNDPLFYRVLKNTIRLSLLNLAIIFPLTIIFALMMNEVKHNSFKRVTQTMTYFPHFLSWVVVGSFVYQLLSPTHGAVNSILIRLGLIQDPIYFMIRRDLFTPIYLIATIWKELGWSIILYLATIAGIDGELYEAAEIDGATRLQRVIYVTLPGMLPMIATLFILRLGTILNVGFDPIFNLYNEGTYEVADVISTFVYRRGLLDARYDYTTAIGLFQNVIGFILVILGNFVIKRLDSEFEVI